MIASTLNKPSSRVLRFLLSGGLATSTHWALMSILLVYGANASMATAVGGATGALANYLLQRRFTFQSKLSHRDTVPIYIVAVMVAWIANVVTFTALHGTGLSIPVAQVTTSLLVALLNFWLYKRIVFHDRRR